MIVNEHTFTGVDNVYEEPYNIINISDFNSLIAQSQKYNVPVFSLTDEQIEQSGSVLKASMKNRNTFHDVFSELSGKIVALTN